MKRIGYIQMISIHGLVRGSNIEMGRDADTGGQIRYVLDLIKELAQFDEVEQVDLFTRQIRDKRVSKDYSVEIEELGPKARIVRLPCGGGRYIRKEMLWPHLDEYVDRMISFTRGEGRIPNVVHGHYADAAYVARQVASIFGAPFIMTAHSLGRCKLDYFEETGWDRDKMEQQYNISTRIHEEEASLAEADLVVCSTNFEREQMYGLYDNHASATFAVIPPGLDLSRFFPYYNYDLAAHEIDEESKQARVRMQHELNRFYFQMEKPLILALCRPDKRKNISSLIQCFGEDKELQAMANLAVFAGIRRDITDMNDDEQTVLTDMLLQMDRYDLYGRMAIPKKHDPDLDVPEMYRLVASNQGVFVSPAYVENFGLTFLEASACGLPFVGSHKGGPTDIVGNCENGLLVDLTEPESLTRAIKKLLTDEDLWAKLSNNGIINVREQYNWHRHCEIYLDKIGEIASAPVKTFFAATKDNKALGEHLSAIKNILISDIDDTLLGDEKALAVLIDNLRGAADKIAVGVATGRHIESARDVLAKNGMDLVTIFITSVGTEIYYGPDLAPDKGWRSTIAARWKPEKIQAVLDQLDFLYPQKDDARREFKISYNLDEDMPRSEAVPIIHDTLSKARLAYNLILSHGSFLDVLPYRASKGKAIRYLAAKWNIPLENIVTAGNSDNDRDMLKGNMAAIVVSNSEEELENLRRSSRVYFAKEAYAAGVLEGMRHYKVLS